MSRTTFPCLPLSPRTLVTISEKHWHPLCHLSMFLYLWLFQNFRYNYASLSSFSRSLNMLCRLFAVRCSLVYARAFIRDRISPRHFGLSKEKAREKRNEHDALRGKMAKNYHSGNAQMAHRRHRHHWHHRRHRYPL